MFFRRIGTKKGPSMAPVRRVRLCLEQLEDRTVPSAVDLGAAGRFNAFVFNDYNGFYSDVEGRLAVGRDANLTGYGVGASLTNSNGTRDDLIVGHDLKYTYGQVFNGNVRDGHSASLVGVGIPNGSVIPGSPLPSDFASFAAVQTDLAAKSTTWSQFGTTGTIANNWGNLTLKGTNATLNVFDLSAAQLQNIWSLKIDAPAGSTVLVNVSGTNISLQNLGMSIDGTDHSRVLFNFNQATQLTLSGIGFQGNILAPNAKVTFNNGSVLGTLVANSFSGQGQMNLSAINIVIPEFVPATISGRVVQVVYDSNNVPHFTGSGIAPVQVFLQGVGVSVSLNVAVNPDGSFSFTVPKPGQYTLSIANLTGKNYSIVALNVGTVNGVPNGTASLPSGQIKKIQVTNGTVGLEYDFGLDLPSGGHGG